MSRGIIHRSSLQNSQYDTAERWQTSPLLVQLHKPFSSAGFKILKGASLACPFFVPTSKADDIAWLHPSRLPLGAGWKGHCGAPGHEGFQPTPEEIKENCNLGYAAACPRLPQQRDYDSVRFSVIRRSPSLLGVCFVLEFRHRPVGHGTLEYYVAAREWAVPHSNEAIQRMADCYVQSYLCRIPAMVDLDLEAPVNCDPKTDQNN